MIFSSLDIMLAALLLLLRAAGISILFSRCQNFIVAATFLISGAASLMALFSGFTTLVEGKRETVLLLVGLPDLPFHLRLDPLSGFFLVVVALIVFLVSIYSLEYVRGIAGKRPVTHLTFFTPSLSPACSWSWYLTMPFPSSYPGRSWRSPLISW